MSAPLQPSARSTTRVRSAKGSASMSEKAGCSDWVCPPPGTPPRPSWTISYRKWWQYVTSWRRETGAAKWQRSGCRSVMCWMCCSSGCTWLPWWRTASHWAHFGLCGRLPEAPLTTTANTEDQGSVRTTDCRSVGTLRNGPGYFLEQRDKDRRRTVNIKKHKHYITRHKPIMFH